MAIEFPDNVVERCSTVGQGDLILAGAVSGSFTFASRLTNGQKVYYRIKEGSRSEGGEGTFVSATNRITRDRVIFSTAGGTTKVTLAGNATVWADVCGEWFDAQASGSNPATFDAENKAGGTLSAGATVAPHSSGSGVVAAQATSITTACVGLLTASAANGVSATVQTGGLLTLSDWTSIIGATQLTARGKYFLSGTAGRLTETPPSTTGQMVQFVGTAVAPDTLMIEIGDPILL